MSNDLYARYGFAKKGLIEAIRLGEGRLTERELARAFDLKGEQHTGLKQALLALEDAHIIRKTRRGSYKLADGLPPVAVVEVTGRDADGEFLCQPVKPELRGPVIILTPGGRTRGPAAGVGDRILARLSLVPGEKVYEATVIRKLDPSTRRVLCVLRDNNRGPARLMPVNRRARHELIPARGETGKAEDGDLVMTRITSERRHGLKTALIDKVVGRVDSTYAGSMIAIAEHGVPDRFDSAELEQVEAIEPLTMGKREDLRHIPLITIDPADARDHDDAVWATADDDPANKGGWVVMVAIADVAAYVTADSVLDKGARKRGVSVYLPDRVVPMLPERLSNDLCSLRENEERPCLAVRMIFDRNGDRIGYRFIRGWMKSAARLTYEEAQAAIDGTGKGKAKTLLENVLKPLWGAYETLRQARARREPLEIDAPERKIVIGEDGQVQGVHLRQRFDAHRLIEEMMIQANVTAATALEAENSPLIYRVHDEPDSEKIRTLSDFLPTLGLKWTRGERPTPARFNTVLKKARDTDHHETVNEAVLRSQSQAVYETDNIGHFGLNLPRYAHFTSPIRRYADLTVHRALIRACTLGADGQTGSERSQLDKIAEDVTQSERRAMAAERDATDRFIAAWLSERVGGEFQGRITGVTRFGLFVRLLETGADGLCPVSRLGSDEYFVHDASAHTLAGQSSGDTYRLGMPVTVRLDEAMPVTGGLLLDILTAPEPGRPPKDHNRSHDRHRRRNGLRPKNRHARRKR